MKLSSILVACTLILLASCGGKGAEEKNQSPTQEQSVLLTEAQRKNADIQTGVIEQRAISSLLKVHGSTDVPPQNMVSISVPLGGYLKHTKLLPGMHVRKGEAIAIMEDPQYINLQQEYLTTKTKLLFAEAEFHRQEELNKSKASSDKVFQQATMEFTALKISLRSLSEKLKLIGINPETLNENTVSRSITITSPIDGFVSAVKMNIGKYASPSDILFDLVNPNDIHLALTVFEKDIDKLFVGQKLVAYTNTSPEQKYPCTIILIGKDLSPERSVTVHCHFERYDSKLIPGMFMNADIDVRTEKAFVLPNEAIVRYEGKHYVFMVEDNSRYTMQEVVPSLSLDGVTQIHFPGDNKYYDRHFVVKGAYALLMKMKNTEE